LRAGECVRRTKCVPCNGRTTYVANARLLDHICIPKVMISLSTTLRSSKQVKAGDVIVKVGQVNIQNQPLSNLRDLILGDPGSFVVLGFQRGSQVILLLKYFCYCLEMYITIHSCRHEHPVFYRPLLTLLSKQFFESRMMRGTPDFLDKHMSAPSQPTAESKNQRAPLSQMQRQAPLAASEQTSRAEASPPMASSVTQPPASMQSSIHSPAAVIAISCLP
jgi:hypothetical protein